MLKKLQAMVCFTLSKKKRVEFQWCVPTLSQFHFHKTFREDSRPQLQRKGYRQCAKRQKNPAFLSLSSLQRVCCHCPNASVTRHPKDIAKSGLDTETIRKKTQNTFLSVGGSILVVTLQLSHHSQVFKEVGSFKVQTYKAQHSRCL